MAEIIITWMLLFSCIFLLIASVILARNRVDLTPLPMAKSGEQPAFSILIPARNEEENIERCVHSACRQNYQNFEVLVLDDDSTDRTPEILSNLQKQYPHRLKIKNGRKKPESWLGKSWACYQLSEAAAGSYYVFIDSDVWLKPDTLLRTLSAFNLYQLDMITIWPRQVLGTFWEKTLIPLVYYALITLLPAVYVYRPPRWLPEFLQQKTRRLFAAACGQFLAFQRTTYEKSDGHYRVKESPVEDVSLARSLLRSGFRMRMFEGTDTVDCRMYTSEKEIRKGFRKNFFAGFGYSLPLFMSSAIVHFIVYVLPFIILPLMILSWQPALFFISLFSICQIFIHWIILSSWFGWNPLYACAHPVGVIWFQMLGILALYDSRSGNKTDWKNRSV